MIRGCNSHLCMPGLSAKSQSGERTAQRGYEPRDVRAKWIFAVVAFLFVAGLVMHFCLAGVMERMQKKPTPQDHWTGLRRDSAAASESRPIPHLQITPPEDLKKFREREDTDLTSYGWI